MKIKISSLISNTILSLVFLVGFQFKNIPATFIFLLGIVGVVFWVWRYTVRIPLELLVLSTTFSIYFFIFKNNASKVYMYHYGAYWIGPIVGYLVGYCCVKKLCDNNFSIVRKMIMAICAGTTLFALVCTLYKFSNMGIYNGLVSSANMYYTMIGRYSLNFWNNELIQPTNLNSMCVFPILLSFYAINYIENIKVKILYWFSLGVAIVVIFTTATRTNLVLLLVGFVISAFLSRKDIHFHLKKSHVLFISIAFIVVFAFSFKLIDLLENSLLASRTESLDNNRWNSMLVIINSLADYPFGNMPYTNAHNMWIDVARVAGIIPLSLLIVYSLMVFLTLCRLRKNKVVPQEIKTLVMGLSFGLLISFMIEPVIEGRPFNFMFFCIINGMSYALSKIGYRFRDEEQIQ